MNMSNNLLPLIARILISIVFIKSGIYKIQHFQETSKHMYDAGLTLATDFFLAGAIFLLLAGGLSLITGYKSKFGAFMLILFLVPTTLAFHWDLADAKQVNNLLSNGVYLAALLMIVSFGTGDLSFGKKL
jgi:putative oxidoreductase